VEDTPDDLVFDLHAEMLWPGHPYGFPILGTRDTVSGLSAEDLRDLHQRAYHPRHVVIAAAGSLNHDLLLKLVGKYGWFAFPPGPDPLAVTPVPGGARGTRRVARDSAQTHIVMGTDTFGYTDPRRYALNLLNTVLGSGMSSRLFQRVREELGLAYAVYSFQSFYRNSGVTGVYVGTHPSSAVAAADAIAVELGRLAAEGLAGDALVEAKQQLRGQVTLSFESPAARMHRLAGFSLYGEPYRSIDQVLAEIDQVTAEQVAEVAAEFLQPERHTVVWLGPH